MIVEQHVNKLFNSVTYKIGNAIIDPGDFWSGFRNSRVVLLTHAHFDHISGLNKLIEIEPNLRVYTNSIGREMLLNAKKNLSFYHDTPFVFEYPERIICVEEDSEIYIDSKISAKAYFTPGHNPSCITWEIEDAIFTGDSFIPGIKTVTNLPHSDKRLAEISEDLIRKLALDKVIYPGHKL